jgi:hypothetical protein
MIFGPEYTKINTLWKRDEKGTILPGEYATPELEYLAELQWDWDEKIDGTNIRLHWDGKWLSVGGRTDKAQLPPGFDDLMYKTVSPGVWDAVFPDAAEASVTVYGEGYGAGIQKGGHYRPDKSFIAFDVKVGPWWLSRDNVADVCDKLGLDMVPPWYPGTIYDTWTDLVTGKIKSCWLDAPLEGLVGRPRGVNLFTSKGDRLMVKMKIKDWTDYEKKVGLPKGLVRDLRP